MRSCAHLDETNLKIKELEVSEFIDAMSRAVNGVSIVTTEGHLGRYGLTVSSMTSVSAEPPMLLVCVNRASAAHDAIRDNGRFAINVLGAVQHRLAGVFAGNSEYGDPYSFDRESWDLAEGLPRLRSASAFFECELESAMTFGSHSIIVGRVMRSCSGNDSPLLYTGRNYGRPVSLY
jgi:flavin reductase